MIIDVLYSFDVDEFRVDTGKVTALKINKDMIIKYTFINKSGNESVVNILVRLISKGDLDKNYKYNKRNHNFKNKYTSCGRIIFTNYEEWDNFLLPNWLRDIEKI